MTLKELSQVYRASARTLKGRIDQLRRERDKGTSQAEINALDLRIAALEPLEKEARDLAAVMDQYYDRGYRKNAKYCF
jgi:hypothetical protein